SRGPAPRLAHWKSCRWRHHRRSARRRGPRARVNAVLAALVVAASLVPAEPTAAASVDWRDEAIYMVMTDRFKNGDPLNDLDSVPGRADWWHGGEDRKSTR